MLRDRGYDSLIAFLDELPDLSNPSGFHRQRRLINDDELALVTVVCPATPALA